MTKKEEYDNLDKLTSFMQTLDEMCKSSGVSIFEGFPEKLEGSDIWSILVRLEVGRPSGVENEQG